MENCGFGWQNRILDAALTADAQVAALPVDNLRQQQGAPSLGWRVPGTTARVRIEVPSISPWRAFSLHRTNLTPDASWRVRVIRGGFAALDQTLACHTSGGQCVFVAPYDYTGTVAELTIDDPGNPDGFLSIPLAYAGTLWQPARNFSTSSSEKLTSGEQSTTTLSGGEFVDPRYVQRGLSIAHQSLGDADADVVRPMLRAAATGQNVLFVPDPAADVSAVAQTPLFGRLSGADLSNPFGTADRHAITLTMTERL